MVSKLYLFGGGPPFTPKLTKSFSKHVLLLDGPVSILFVDRKTEYDEYMNRITKPLREFGLRNYHYMPLPTIPVEIAINNIQESAGIIILGGDTNKYADFIVETRLASVIKEKYVNGVPVAGFSAGALISLDPCIISPKDNRDNKFQTRRGLGLTSNIQLAVHFSEWDDKNHLKEMMRKFPDKQNYGIDENTGIYVENGRIEVMEGKGVYRIIGGDFVKLN